MMETLHIDEIDRKIINIIEKDPITTHTVIAKKVNRSQPSVTMRIKKLEECGIIKHQVGLDCTNMELYLAKVDLQTNSPAETLRAISECSHVIHAYRTSGTNSFSVVIASFEFKDLERIVNYHFRNNPVIKTTSMEIITEILSDFVLPIRLYNNECDCLKQK